MKTLLFSAAWCSSCSVVKKHLDNHPANTVELVDMDTPEGGRLAVKYNVRSLPTLVHREGDEIVHTVGAEAIMNKLGNV